MTESPHVVVRGEAVAEALPDAPDGTRGGGSVATVTTRVQVSDVAAAVADALARARGYAAALGARITGLVEIRDAGTGGGAGRVARASLAAAAPALELQPGPHEVHGSVEMTFTMSPPDQEVHAR